MSDSSRRELLKGAVGVGVAVSLAGCAEELEDEIEDLEALLEDEDGGESGESDDPDDPEVTPGELPAFHQWLYAPGEAGLEPYTYASADFSEIDGEFDPLEDWREFRWTTETIRDIWNDGMFDDADAAVVMEYEDSDSFAAVVEGEFDRSRMRDEFEEIVDMDPNVEFDTYRGYDIYFEDQHAVSIGDEDVQTFLQVQAPPTGSANAREILEATIDARGEHAPRLADVDTTAEALLGTVENHEFVFGATEPVGQNEPIFQHQGQGSVEGASVAVRNDTYRLLAVMDEPVSDEDAFIEQYDIAAVLDDPAVSTNGQLVMLEGEIGGPEPGTGDAPDANFEVEFHTDHEVAEIAYTHGEEIPADELEIVIDGDSRRHIRWAEIGHSDVAHPGEIVPLELEPEDSGGELAFIWVPEGEVLSTVDVPEFDTDSDAPSASFDARFDFDSGVVEFAHVGGDPIPADELEVIVDSADARSYPWIELERTEVVHPGDMAELPISEADEGGELLFRWHPGSEILDTVEIPDGGTTTGDPTATFDADFNLDRDEVRVTHVEGDEISARELVLVFQGDHPRELYWAELSGESTAAAGDSVTTDLYRDDYGGTLLVGWEPQYEVLTEFQIPDRHDDHDGETA